MSPKLPVVSGQQLIQALEKFGYVAVREAVTCVCATRLTRVAFPYQCLSTLQSQQDCCDAFCVTRKLQCNN